MLEASAIPDVRVRALNDAPVRDSGDYVLYWMVANRRHDFNFSLERAVEWAKELGKPLVVLEALRVGYRWASDRLHAFVIQGMRDNAARFESRCVTYFPYLERKDGEGSGLLAALGKRASVVVTDDFPAFFYPADDRGGRRAVVGAAGGDRRQRAAADAGDGQGVRAGA